jgi:signal transduction histidine kinase
MSKGKWWRLSERTRMLLTLELAIALPAAALIGFTVLNLRSIQRDRAVEAAIQRDFSYLLKSAEKRMNERGYELVRAARADFPCPDEAGGVPAKLERILERHPAFSTAYLYDHKAKSVVGRARPGSKAASEEAEKMFDGMGKWMPLEAPGILEKMKEATEKEGKPAIFYYAHYRERDGKRLYNSVAYFVPPELPAGRVALAGVTFDPVYLQQKFFPEMLKQVLVKDADPNARNPAVMMLHVRKESEPLAVSDGWDGGKPEVERAFEDVFPGVVMAVKYRGTTIQALSDHFLRDNFIVVGALSLFLVIGVGLTYRNMSREMALAKLKSDFVANVSHELRTPLALIRLYAETLEMGRLSTPEKHQEYYRIIRKESERLTALINNILDFSRIEAGRKEYDFRETNLAELVRQTLESYRYQIEQNGFAFEEKIDEDIPPVRVDREAIARSLVNLINNAIKYSPNEKFLGVKLYRSNGDVRLEVIDHGIGIPRGEQGKIFEKFYRAGDPLVHTTKGSGLGLSLVQHIVEAHGGQVSVESAPGKGSRFVIALPAQSAAMAHAN